MLEAKDLSCKKNSTPIFKGVNFSLAAGEALHIQGRNGSGKTSLLRMLAGLTTPETGQVNWMGDNILDDTEGFNSSLLYIGHQPPIKAALTVHENLSFSLKLSGINCTPAQERMAIETAGLGNKINKPGHTLSSGQKMRLALSKLSIGNRPLWLLDEPFNSLDLEASKDLDALINQHLGGGGMVVITTHQALNINPNNLQTICLGS